MAIKETPPKAKYDYRSGNLLLIPTTGFAPGLFLEFLQHHSDDNKSGRPGFRIEIHESASSKEDHLLHIRMPFELRDTFHAAVKYINDNLPED